MGCGDAGGAGLFVARPSPTAWAKAVAETNKVAASASHEAMNRFRLTKVLFSLMSVACVRGVGPCLVAALFNNNWIGNFSSPPSPMANTWWMSFYITTLILSK